MPGAMLAAAALLAPVAVRLALIAERDVAFSFPDLRGLYSDLAVSLFFLVALVLACRWTRWLAMVLVGLWCVLNYGNYEHVAALGSLASLTQAHYLADATFLKGSVLSPTHPLLLAGILGGSCTLVWLGTRPRSAHVPLLPLGAAAVLGLIIHPLWLTNDEMLQWQQTNVVYENFRWLIKRPPETTTQAGGRNLTPIVASRIESLYRADLNGEPLLELGRRDTNVLLVLLEGISGVHMDSIAKRHGIAHAVNMPRLDRIAQDNMAYRSFVSHQRQTNRGEYAILCGDYPKLVVDEPKMTEVLALDNVVCLPSVLRDAGYETVYLQAAPLGFMSKDLFMPKIGFSQVYGERWFKRAYARNQWGIDDRAYFEQSLEMVRRLESSEGPWFLTLLTVGTHHPYIVPSSDGNRTFASAARYLDEAFAEFLGRLQAEGLLKNTLVMITSDESVGVAGYRGHKRERAGEGLDDLTKKLSENWGFLIVIPPTGEQMRVDAEFMQADLALSILDYLGLDSEAQDFVGRSVFRRYEGTRPIVFANVYKRWLGALDPSGRLSICPQDFQSCSTYELTDGRLFSPNRTRRETDLAAVEFLRGMVARSQQAKDRRRTLPLLAEPIVPLSATAGMQVIFGGQYLSVPAYTRIDVDLEVEVEGRSGSVLLGHLLKAGHKKYLFRRRIPPLEAGDRLTLRYSYTPSEPLQYLEALATVSIRSGGPIALNFKTARMTLVPQPTGSDPATGLELRQFRVVRSAP